jgi:hypothetical protein
MLRTPSTGASLLTSEDIFLGINNNVNATLKMCG